MNLNETKHSNLTLIVDGNWLLMSRMPVLLHQYKDNTSELCRELNLLMIKSINAVLKTFPDIDNIIFVADGGSWRNNVTIPKFLQDEGIEYKGNRVQDPSIDFDSIFKSYENFMQILLDNGITVFRELGIEGDDWCNYLSKRLNNDGTNVIIWSKDKDLTQLVNMGDNGTFTVIWNKDNGVYKMKTEEDEMDILFNMFTPGYSDNMQLLNTILSKSGTITPVNKNIIIIDKIVRGDAGDNIKPIIIRKPNSPKSTRRFRVAEKDIDSTINLFDDRSIRDYIFRLCSMKQYRNRENDKSEQDIFEHFIYNRTLVMLDSRVYPKNIINLLDSNYSKITYSTDLSEVKNIISARKNDISDILDLI